MYPEKLQDKRFHYLKSLPFFVEVETQTLSLMFIIKSYLVCAVEPPANLGEMDIPNQQPNTNITNKTKE